MVSFFFKFYLYLFTKNFTGSWKLYVIISIFRKSRYFYGSPFGDLRGERPMRAVGTTGVVGRLGLITAFPFSMLSEQRGPYRLHFNQDSDHSHLVPQKQ